MSSIAVYYKTSNLTEGTVWRRLNPAPFVKIDYELHYANDNVIGYTYKVTLTGKAAGRQNYNENSTDIANTISSMEFVRKTFDENGGDLEIWEIPGDNDSNSRLILVAKGALIKKIDFRNSSSNYFVNYADYTVDLEFNEIDNIGCENNEQIVCASGIFDENSFSADMVDMYKYKIKAFNDSWSFSLSDTNQEADNEIYNTTIDLNYNISATGKNYYNVDTKDSTILQAWEQAREFVQNRLVQEIGKSLGYMLYVDPSTKQPARTLKDLYKQEAGQYGILKDLSHVNPDTGQSINQYKIYDEMISCDTSETKGTFSANYTCVLKRYNPAFTPDENNVIHTYNKSINISNDQKYSHSISTGGQITGMLPGSIIDPTLRPIYSDMTSRKIWLPKNGNFITAVANRLTKTKYDYARIYFENRASNNSQDDLSDWMKQKLDITYQELGLTYLPEIFQGNIFAEPNQTIYPSPASFNVNHDHHQGTISYDAAYDSVTAVSLKRGYASVSIIRNDPADKVAEFVIPGRAEGPIIQKLNTKSEKTISISINGAHPDNKFCITADSFSNANLCAFLVNGPAHNIGGEITEIINGENDNWIRTKKDFSVNNIDGSFSINLEFLCVGHME